MVTIVVLIILAVISINIVFSEDGIVKKAEDAKDFHANGEAREQEILNTYDQHIANAIAGRGTAGGSGSGEGTGGGDDTPAGGTVSGSSTGTHTATTLSYTWEEMSKIAKVISDNYGTGEGKINRDTAEVTVSVDGQSYTVGVGDTIALTDTNSVTHEVRIIGFNHDELADQSAYGGTNTYAGISLDFVYFLGSNRGMNGSNTNANGWAATQMRKDLNGYATDAVAQTAYGETGLINTLSNKTYIKRVKKDYIPTYNNASTTKSEDYLWLLSCGEIWSSGYSGGDTRGYAIGKEGEQYKWYKDKETGGTSSWNTSNTNFVKKANSSASANIWWLRSPYYSDASNCCYVNASGFSDYNLARGSYGVAPGFAI